MLSSSGIPGRRLLLPVFYRCSATTGMIVEGMDHELMTAPDIIMAFFG
jgi:hypothetical protein